MDNPVSTSSLKEMENYFTSLISSLSKKNAQLNQRLQGLEQEVEQLKKSPPSASAPEPITPDLDLEKTPLVQQLRQELKETIEYGQADSERLQAELDSLKGKKGVLAMEQQVEDYKSKAEFAQTMLRDAQKKIRSLEAQLRCESALGVNKPTAVKPIAVTW